MRKSRPISSWSAPDSWRAGARHPGRGKYMIKTGGRLGIPMQMTLTATELDTFGRLLRKLLPESDAVPVGGCAPAEEDR